MPEGTRGSPGRRGGQRIRMSHVPLEQVIETLWPTGTTGGASVWAILDCARDARIFPALQASRLEYLSLYAGQLPETLKRAAPHMVELAPGYRFTRPLLEMGWGRSWGIFIRTREPLNLRHHLRKFLRVQDESGRNLVFRFYDPRVLRVFLPTCDATQLKALFGVAHSYITEDRDGGALLEFTFDGRKLLQRRTELAMPQHAS